MSSNSQNQLLLTGLNDMYDAEQRFEEALGELASDVDDEELRNAFEEHREQTRTHVDRLEQVFDSIGVEPSDEECEVAEALVKEHDDFSEKNPDQAELELFDLTAAQKTEHYEIAAYGNLAKLADELGLEEEGDLLHQNLEEEEETLEKLVELTEDFDYDRLQSQ